MRFRLMSFLGALSVAASGAFQPAIADPAPVKIKIAEMVRSQLYIPMYVAISKKFAAQEGLEVEFLIANGGDRVGAMVLANQADFGLAGPEVPIFIHNGESPDKPLIFCALTATDGFFLASRKKIDKFEWSMLNGSKILGLRPGSAPQLYFEYLLKRNGVNAETIKNITTNISVPARDGAWVSGSGDFAIFIEPNLSKHVKSGEAHLISSIGKDIGRADYTVFFAKRSWLDKNAATAQKWTNAIAKAQAWVAKASAKEIAEAIAPFFPSLSLEDNMAVINRYRETGVLIWAESPVVSEPGLAKAQEIMISGGVLTPDKTVPYKTIVTTSYADKAK